MVSGTMTNLKDDLQENKFLGVLMNDLCYRIVATFRFYPTISYSLHDICSSILMRVQNQFNNTNEYIFVQRKVEYNNKTSKSRTLLIKLECILSEALSKR